MLSLPTSIIPAENPDPKFVIIYGKPKSGKSTIASALEDNLCVDLEDGYAYLSCKKVGVNSFDELMELIKLIQEANSSSGKKVYKYITIDNGTILEDLLLPYAKLLYTSTPQGKNFKGDDVRDLPNGAGYRFTRMALSKVIDKFKTLCDCLILMCHVKDSAINHEGKELTEFAPALTGASARIMSAQTQAIGFLYRKKNATILNFNGGNDFIVESRVPHLRGKEIVIAESDESNNITVYWDKIFPSAKSSRIVNQAA